MNKRKYINKDKMNKRKYINKDKMNNKGELLSLFPIPVVVVNIGRDFTKDELQLLLSDIPMGEKNEGMTNHRSVNLTLFDSHADILGDIKKECEHHLKRYMEEIEGVDTNLAGLRITQSWLNKTKPGEYHHPHSHPNSYLSGVLYINCLPNDSINFENRMYGMFNNMEFSKKKINEWNSIRAIVNVKKGDLIIFSSWVAHHVDVNETKNRERISLSFNTFPIGELGESSSATHLKL